MNLTELRTAVADRPELLAIVNELDMSRYRLTRILFDLGRLNEALIERVTMIERLEVHPLGAMLSDNVKQLLIAVISFISHVVEDQETNASQKLPGEVFNDLMKRM